MAGGEQRKLSVDMGIAAHELRTPLTAILAAAELLRDGAEESPEVHRFADLILRNADRLGGLIDDLVQLAELDQESDVRGQPVAVDELIDRVAHPRRAALSEHGIELRTRCGAGPCVPGDRRLLHDALGRVVDNAVAATATGGVVALTARLDGRDWHIDVTDDGPAVSSVERDRVFEPFFRPDGRHKGLGLAIAAAVVRRHGGSVVASSGPGDGLTVTLQLPAMTDPGVT